MLCCVDVISVCVNTCFYVEKGVRIVRAYVVVMRAYMFDGWMFEYIDVNGTFCVVGYSDSTVKGSRNVSICCVPCWYTRTAAGYERSVEIAHIPLQLRLSCCHVYVSRAHHSLYSALDIAVDVHDCLFSVEPVVFHDCL